MLHQEKFPIGKQAALRRIDFHATTETTTEEFPMLLITGRTLYHFNAGTMTMRTENTKLRATDYLDISAVDAEHFALKEGEQVRVISRYGEAVLPLKINASVKPGELFTTFHNPAIFVNHLTSQQRDGYVGAPEYKVTAVKIEPLISH